MPTIWKRCTDCGTKWYFDEDHQRDPEVDVTRCSWCDGPLIMVDEHPPPEGEPAY